MIRSIIHFELALALVAAPASAAEPDLAAFVGRWQIDLSRTHMGRFGPSAQNMVRAPTFSFTFKPAAQGLSLETYSEYPQPAPTRVAPLIADGKLRGCTNPNGCQTIGGNPDEQAFVYVAVNPNYVIRRLYLKGRISEYTSYAVSTDRQIFTMIAWSAATPYWQNIQVFRKQP